MRISAKKKWVTPLPGTRAPFKIPRASKRRASGRGIWSTDGDIDVKKNAFSLANVYGYFASVLSRVIRINVVLLRSDRFVKLEENNLMR